MQLFHLTFSAFKATYFIICIAAASALLIFYWLNISLMQLPHCNKHYKPIYNHLQLFSNSLQSNEDNLFLFDEMKIFLKNWVNRRKQFFAASWAVFSCIVLSIVENVFFCTIYTVLIRLLVALLYYLTWAHGGINCWEKPMVRGT